MNSGTASVLSTGRRFSVATMCRPWAELYLTVSTAALTSAVYRDRFTGLKFRL